MHGGHESSALIDGYLGSFGAVTGPTELSDVPPDRRRDARGSADGWP